MSVVMPLKNVLLSSAVEGSHPTVLSDIYDEEKNIAVWRRQLSEALRADIERFLLKHPTFKLAVSVSPSHAMDALSEALGDTAETLRLRENVANLVMMFGDLFDLTRVGLRLRVLNKAMCPKFHVDRVPCRLITTYQGLATEWLANEAVNRSVLTVINKDNLLNQSGLYHTQDEIQQLHFGDVALLKGESWDGNEGRGIVHRSPAVSHGELRLLLTLDFAD